MGISNNDIGGVVDTSPLGLDGGSDKLKGGKDDYNSKRRNGKDKLAKDKFKSMGSLQMEPSLPPAPM